MHLFTDTVRVGETRRTADGYLVANARTARIGIQNYAGAEVGKPEMPIVRVYRPQDEVFSHDSLGSYGHKPLTDGHPPEHVSAKNYKLYSVGHLDGNVARDGDFVRVPMMMADADAIAAYDAGKVELSAGYRCRLDWTAGKTDDGQPYDAIQRDIRINHVAVVDKGRAGSLCRIGDSFADFGGGETRAPVPSQEERTQTADRDTPHMHKLTIDGVTVDLSDTAREVVSKVVSQNDKLTSDLEAARTKYDTDIKAKDQALADSKKGSDTKDGEIVALKKQLEDAKLTPEKLDAAVAVRAAVVADAKKIIGDAFKPDGKSDADIRREAVAHRIGDAAKSLNDDGVSGAFVLMAADSKTTDPLRTAITHYTPTSVGDAASAAATAHAKRNQDLRDAWKAPSGQA